MAKQSQIDPFARTEPEPGSRQPQPDHLPDKTKHKDDPLKEGRIISSGVGLTEGELAYIDKLAEYYDTTRNSLMSMFIRQMVERVRAGQFDPGALLGEPEKPPKRRYKRPQ